MVSRMEKLQRTPTIDTLLRIAEDLNVDLSVLLKRGIKKTEKDRGQDLDKN